MPYISEQYSHGQAMAIMLFKSISHIFKKFDINCPNQYVKILKLSH